ncbi:hypothetical protein A1O1_05592 [Capronia coronata CBS 617.96]|uniref:Uncharacterized protein n=1 Tax=Capronia coronata CBS 617.96 TaxID=1182541 RepID=W9YHB9_9EURO|nr:uncharacterized protein A1O1_05592 [Capronia coronata CBS 617.96]EXJ88661.1 hypothetical protein A1O1_05592 [Capronia coronata CBS 617.96]
MAENAEEEFARLPSEELLEDTEMHDFSEPGERDLSQLGTYRERTVEPCEGVLLGQQPESEPMQSIEQESEEPKGPSFIIAIDFGTTFSSVAFVRLEPDKPTHLVGIDDIECIDNFPDMLPGPSADILAHHPTVPTELMCHTQQDKPRPEDPLESESSDHDSCPSLDHEWASSSADDSDQEREEVKVSVARTEPNIIRTSDWGWGVHSRLAKPNPLPPGLAHLKSFKLLLDDSPATRDLRQKSALAMRMLKPAKVMDVISEYLEHLFRHTKARLTATHGLRRDSPVEFVICVPNSWTDTACRVMHDALAKAVKMPGQTHLEHATIKDLFIVAEAEAAATYALETRDYLSKVALNGSFLLLDCGGGTVDAITYKLTNINPARLEEVVKPEGVCCGSSFLNERYRTLLQRRLEDATIIGNDTPLERIISKLVQDFESEKRRMNIVDQRANFDSLYIQGLEDDRERGIRKNRLDLKRKEMYDEVFKYCIRGVEDLMRKQLNEAKEKKVNVETVIVIGGFGESPSLINHLKKMLRKERNHRNQRIDLEPSRHVESAVARGAVLRALRKENGPGRITRSSYGILQSQRYNEDDLKHRKFRVSRSPADGELYIMNTINWIIHKDTTVPTRYETSVKSRHIFKVSEPEFLCEEVLYVSSRSHESGYKVGHKANKGAQEEGRILADLTFLRTQNHIEPKTETNAQGKSYSYYEIFYDLWIIIEGRNLRFEARSPIDGADVKATKQFSIAAGFVPGTA